jgi:hypothetical protein
MIKSLEVVSHFCFCAALFLTVFVVLILIPTAAMAQSGNVTGCSQTTGCKCQGGCSCKGYKCDAGACGCTQPAVSCGCNSLVGATPCGSC